MPVNSRTKLSPVGPRNRGQTRSARTGLDRWAAAAVEQSNNALAVDGLPVVFYRRLRSGIPCTCSARAASNTIPNTTKNLLDVDLGTSTSMDLPEAPDTMRDTEGITIKIRRHGARGVEGKDLAAPDAGSVNRVVSTSDIDDPHGEILTADDFSDLGTGFDGFAGININGCAVCFGTRFVGGYSPLGAVRLVFDVQTKWDVFGLTLSDTFPRALDPVTSGGRAQWTFTLPKGVAALDCLRLWNNKDQVTTNWALSVWDGVAWQDASSTILSLCDGQAHTFRLDTKATFTHLEIQFATNSSPIYVAWPNVSESQNPDLPLNLDSVSVQLSPFLGSVRVGDVIAEPKYKHNWLVTNVTDKKDRENRVFGWEATLRFLQQYEFQSLLFNRLSKHWMTRVQQTAPQFKTDTYEPFSSGQQTKAR